MPHQRNIEECTQNWLVQLNNKISEFYLTSQTSMRKICHCHTFQCTHDTENRHNIKYLIPHKIADI